MLNFLETIPAYLNFAEFSDLFLYPKKLSYSSSNAYIKKLRVRLLGNASCMLKNAKTQQTVWSVCHFCEFCEKDARFPRVEFVGFPNNSLNFNEKNISSEKGCHFCEFCENDARFPRVEFVDFPNYSLNFHEKTHKFTKCSRKPHLR